MRRYLIAAVLLFVATGVFAQDRVMFPVLSRETPGANGTIWHTRLLVHNASALEAHLAPNMSCQNTCFGYEIIDPGQVRELSWQLDPNAPSELGRFAELLLGDPRDISFHLVAEDLTRLNLTAGTELPVVRETEFLSGVVHLPGVTANANYRHRLRIYTSGTPALVTVRSYSVDISGMTQVTHEESIGLATSDAAHFFPSAELPLDAFFPVDGAYVIEVRAEGATPLWAFISTTNNTTQHILTITPQ